MSARSNTTKKNSSQHAETDSTSKFLDLLDNKSADFDGLRKLSIEASAASAGRRGRFHRQSPPGQRGSEVMQTADGVTIHLVEEKGVLRWKPMPKPGPQIQSPGRAALRRAVVNTPGNVLRSYEFERIPASNLYRALVALDQKLTPDADYGITGQTGIRYFDSNKKTFVPYSATGKELEGRKILLLIHGTFSKSETFFGKIEGGENDRKSEMITLMTDALVKGYDKVLAFDHPTLSVSPMLNAFDLAARLRDLGMPSQIDIICHSRGGLVTRWFCEALAPHGVKRRAVLVACPLGGTSIAAPHRIRHVFNLLTNVARTGSVVAGVFAGPLMIAVKGLMQITASVTGALSGPLADAVVALVPGFDAQSRTGNNPELLRLHANTGGSVFNDPAGDVRYWSILSNFEPREVPGWGFLKFFSKPLQSLVDSGADLIFEDANDLVVDTASMTEASRGVNAIQKLHDFGTNPTVHHINYFDQPETAASIRQAFGF